MSASAKALRASCAVQCYNPDTPGLPLTVQIECYRSDVPGLVVHREVAYVGGRASVYAQVAHGSWVITHERTGFQIGNKTWSTREGALTMCRALGPLADWTSSFRDISTVDRQALRKRVYALYDMKEPA